MASLLIFYDLIRQFAEINKTVILSSCERHCGSPLKDTPPTSLFAVSNAHPLPLRK